jgi:O-succinylbenzoic acid--CoA ligase
VAVLAWNQPTTVVLFFAVRRLGAALVPLNARLTEPELRPQLQRARPRLLLADQAHASLISGATPLEVWTGTPAEAWPADDSDAEADWAVVFTSGTTGQPKAACLTVGAFDALARASRANLGSRPGDRWLCSLPLFHVGGLAMVVRCATDGAVLQLQSRFDAQETVKAVGHDRVTHLSLVARALEEALDAGLGAADLRGVLVGGGPVPPRLAERARAAGIPILLTYGLTEACSQVTTERPGQADGLTAGPPLPGLEVRILDAGGKELAPGVEGSIAVRGPTLMRGYLEDPPGTEEVLRDGWLHTGDVGQWDERGRLTVLARRTDLILSGGENVYPAEVEAVLAAHPALAEVAVVARPDPRWGQVPVAVVVLRGRESPGDLRTWARARLAGFKVPAEVLTASALPRTAAGKIDRAAVAALAMTASGACDFQKARGAESPAVEPRFK